MSTSTPPEYQRVRRSTGEVVLLILTGTVAVLLVVALVIVGVLKNEHPTIDVDMPVGSLSAIISVLVGAVISFVAGRRGVVERNGA